MAAMTASGVRVSGSTVSLLRQKSSASQSRLAFSPQTTIKSRRSLGVRASAATIDELVASIKSLTLEQAKTLTDRLQEELGVTAAAFAPAAVAAPGAGGGSAEAAPAVEEKTEFDLILEEVPASSRIAVIKVVRALTGLGLKEAKDMIEGLPKKVKEAVAQEDADEGKKQLEGAGAKASVK